ncbi:hypothetical protein GCM10025868_37180 [Angustibacter aerolatus]|uniref:CobQ/CobB/MinD/ParA nucleotide binding domain-containing protein n=1 Tax=Angustibacter aerolatus TaxID=1162965 RepID=A0ABQ6JJT8_9ACTN|nr:hypothetical protein GCM10025868_37180 [Angustibacter aerolatus]
MAPRRNGATLTALAHADVVVAVGGADPIGLQRLVRALPVLAEVGPAAARPVVVVNRLRAGSVGPSPRRAVQDALARWAGVDDPVLLPDDPVAADASVLQGRTLAECAPRSALRAAVGEARRADRRDGAREPPSPRRTSADRTTPSRRTRRGIG